MDAIQTDAGMTDGMVGGALVTLEGKLLGLNLLYNPDVYGRNSGIGFAIPVSAIEPSLPKLMRGENVEPGFMGISTPMLNKDGEIVFTGVAPAGPAGTGGLKAKDVLREVDGESAGKLYATPTDFIEYVKSKAPGRILRLRVLRGKTTVDLEITLGSRPGD